jgi:hypothetical protein
VPLVERTPAHQAPLVPFDDGAKDADGQGGRGAPGWEGRIGRELRSQDLRYPGVWGGKGAGGNGLQPTDLSQRVMDEPASLAYGPSGRAELPILPQAFFDSILNGWVSLSWISAD